MERKMDPHEGKSIKDLTASRVRLLLVFGVRYPRERSGRG
jgi:hypothetical protein